MCKISGFRSMYQGWGAILPRQLILSAWINNLPKIDSVTDEILGVKRDNKVQVVIKEMLLGIGGYLIAYPFLTAQRRVACQETHIGMPAKLYKGTIHCMWKVIRHEGVEVLYRGIGIYSIAIAAWVFAMPTMTQAIWQEFENSARTDIAKLMRLE